MASVWVTRCTATRLMTSSLSGVDIRQSPCAYRTDPPISALLQQAQVGQGSEGFDNLLYERLDGTLEDYLRVLQDSRAPELKTDWRPGTVHVNVRPRRAVNVWDRRPRWNTEARSH